MGAGGWVGKEGREGGWEGEREIERSEETVALL